MKKGRMAQRSPEVWSLEFIFWRMAQRSPEVFFFEFGVYSFAFPLKKKLVPVFLWRRILFKLNSSSITLNKIIVFGKFSPHFFWFQKKISAKFSPLQIDSGFFAQSQRLPPKAFAVYSFVTYSTRNAIVKLPSMMRHSESVTFPTNDGCDSNITTTTAPTINVSIMPEIT
jgi:hypothetical protein